MKSSVFTPVLLLAAAALVTACTTTPYYDDRYYSDRYYDDGYYGDYSRLYTRPPPRVEYRGYPPYPNYIWMDGYWTRVGTRHDWVPGYWAPPGTRDHRRRLADARERARERDKAREKERMERERAREKERLERDRARERELRERDRELRERERKLRERDRRLREMPTFSRDPDERIPFDRRTDENRPLRRPGFERPTPDGREGGSRPERPRIRSELPQERARPIQPGSERPAAPPPRQPRSSGRPAFGGGSFGDSPGFEGSGSGGGGWGGVPSFGGGGQN